MAVNPALIGWRGMFAVGLVPALVVRCKLDEPDIFTKRHAATRENSFRLLVKDEKTRRITLGVIILCVVRTFG